MHIIQKLSKIVEKSRQSSFSAEVDFCHKPASFPSQKHAHTHLIHATPCAISDKTGDRPLYRSPCVFCIYLVFIFVLKAVPESYFSFAGSTFFETKYRTMHATAHTTVSICRPVPITPTIESTSTFESIPSK